MNYSNYNLALFTNMRGPGVLLFTLCDFKGARSIGSVQVDLFDKFNVGQKINKGHEKWIGYLATLTC